MGLGYVRKKAGCELESNTVSTIPLLFLLQSLPPGIPVPTFLSDKLLPGSLDFSPKFILVSAVHHSIINVKDGAHTQHFAGLLTRSYKNKIFFPFCSVLVSRLILDTT